MCAWRQRSSARVVCLRLDAGPTIAALLYLTVIVLLASRMGNFLPAIFVSVIATLCLEYFFIPPVFSFAVNQPVDVVALITFLTAGLVVTGLTSRTRKALQELQVSREQLRLAIDTIPAPVWSALPDGSANFVNQRWLEYTGLSRDEGRGFGEGVAPSPLEERH